MVMSAKVIWGQTWELWDAVRSFLFFRFIKDAIMENINWKHLGKLIAPPSGIWIGLIPIMGSSLLPVRLINISGHGCLPSRKIQISTNADIRITIETMLRNGKWLVMIVSIEGPLLQMLGTVCHICHMCFVSLGLRVVGWSKPWCWIRIQFRRQRVTFIKMTLTYCRGGSMISAFPVRPVTRGCGMSDIDRV